jgi:hypothetical protein
VPHSTRKGVRDKVCDRAQERAKDEPVGYEDQHRAQRIGQAERSPVPITHLPEGQPIELPTDLERPIGQEWSLTTSVRAPPT